MLVHKQHQVLTAMYFVCLLLLDVHAQPSLKSLNISQVLRLSSEVFYWVEDEIRLPSSLVMIIVNTEEVSFLFFQKAWLPAYLKY